jgi:hypothetical protein
MIGMSPFMCALGTRRMGLHELRSKSCIAVIGTEECIAHDGILFNDP